MTGQVLLIGEPKHLDHAFKHLFLYNFLNPCLRNQIQIAVDITQEGQILADFIARLIQQLHFLVIVFSYGLYHVRVRYVHVLEFVEHFKDKSVSVQTENMLLVSHDFIEDAALFAVDEAVVGAEARKERNVIKPHDTERLVHRSNNRGFCISLDELKQISNEIKVPGIGSVQYELEKIHDALKGLIFI